MTLNFSSEFRSFLETREIDFSEEGMFFRITKPAIGISLVNLEGISDNNKQRADITLYEDEWRTKFTLVSNRLLANLGRQRSIFARCCNVGPVTTEVAKEFLAENHLLGYAKSRYRYGLYTNKTKEGIPEGTLVAVAAFSIPRPMNRNGIIVSSYEWIRYANMSNFRVIGGMGKLLSFFVDSVNPDEIMSYADKDWSDGNVYRKLGFEYIGDTPPIEFYVDRLSLKRISQKKLLTFTKCNCQELNIGDCYILRNQGNLKFLWSSCLVR